MPLAKNLIEAAGNATQANYIEDCFSTWLYNGNDTSQTTTNNIDLSTKGGLLWIKARNLAGSSHFFQDSARGANNFLDSTTTGANQNIPSANFAFSTTGFSQNNNYASLNGSGYNYASWTFRKQPKFFDVVTYTGNSTNNRAISHNLGSTPGCIIVKNITNVADWCVWHRSLSSSQELLLNTTDSAYNYGAFESATSTTFTVNDSGYTNQTGSTYVAYIFAHDAGGFGLTGTDNVISCGSYTTDAGGEGPVVNLGWEPQFIIQKDINYSSGSGGDWDIIDNMRGFPSTSSMSSKFLEANTSAAEQSSGYIGVTSTGFRSGGTASHTYIYIAIRRGPMKVPTDGTKVFKPVTRTGNGSTASVTGVGFAPDTVLVKDRNGATDHVFIDKLRGVGSMLRTPQTFAEYNNANSLTSFDQNGVSYSYLNYVNGNTVPYNDLFFKRAPSFFDVVCFSGNYSATSYSHNLAAVPEMIIIKKRTGSSDWPVYHIGVPSPLVNQPNLNTTVGYSANNWFSSTPTSSVFSTQYLDSGTSNYVAYLFATCAGVSKVGSYTGTGTTKQIDCGFAAGARFVLIKRTDSTGDWYVWDTVRGIVSGNDPYLLLNSTAAETTSTDYIDTYSAGFELSSTAPAALNASGGTYIFLAIA